MEPETKVTPEQLEEATKSYAKALELRDSEPETAVELLGKVLETRNKAYGEKALESADVYLYYGELLFEQAQANTDYFGDQMKSAAMQRARHIAAGEGGAAGSGDEAEEDEEDDDDIADEQGTIEAAEAAGDAGEAEPAAKAETAAAAAADGEAGDGKPGQPGQPAAPAGAQEEQQQQQQEVKNGQQQGDGEGEQEGDEESDDDEDVGSEEAAAEGQEAAGGPEVTGETDDMALAWEMLEMARIIYNQHGGGVAHANKLADCHMYIGDILCEQEKFEEAVPEYNTALELLAQLEGGLQAHKRRAAELDFKKATALQLTDQPAEALDAMHSAKAHLQARLNEVNVELGKSGAAGSSGAAAAAAGDAAGAAAFAAFAAVLTGYSKPAEKEDGSEAAAAAGTTEDADKAAAVAKQQQEVADLRSLIDSMNDRIDELKAAVEEHTSMREQLRKTFEMVAAGKGGEEASGEGGSSSTAAASAAAPAAGGAVESVGFAAPTMQSGPVRDMGVIGKGKRVAPVPVAPTAAAAVAGEENGEAGKKRPLSDLVSSDQENSNDAAGGSAAAGKPSPAVAAQQPDALPKKARADA